MPKDPLEEALDKLIALSRSAAVDMQVVANGNLSRHKQFVQAVDEREEFKRDILAHARWIGDDEDCTCTPDGDACTYCSNKYQLERERTKE